MWKCIKTYKISGYRKGMKLSDSEIQMRFMWRKSLKQVQNIKKGKIYSIDHPIAELSFKKISEAKK